MIDALMPYNEESPLTTSQTGARPTVETYPDGSFLGVRVPSRWPSLSDSTSKGGGIRGVIRRFSKRAQKTMRKALGMVRREAEATFVTLTFGEHVTGSDAKEVLKPFLRRMKYRFPTFAALWRIEFENRKTGPNAGKPVPHFHMLVWNVPSTVLTEVLPRLWKEGAVHMEEVENVDKAFRYVRKVEEDEPEGDACGRRWGRFNWKHAPLSRRLEFTVSRDTAFRLMRHMRKFMGLSCPNNSPYPALSMHCDGAQWTKLLLDLIEGKAIPG